MPTTNIYIYIYIYISQVFIPIMHTKKNSSRRLTIWYYCLICHRSCSLKWNICVWPHSYKFIRFLLNGTYFMSCQFVWFCTNNLHRVKNGSYQPWFTFYHIILTVKILGGFRAGVCELLGWKSSILSGNTARWISDQNRPRPQPACSTPARSHDVRVHSRGLSLRACEKCTQIRSD